jgi:hypothetical protein
LDEKSMRRAFYLGKALLLLGFRVYPYSLPIQNLIANEALGHMIGFFARGRKYTNSYHGG